MEVMVCQSQRYLVHAIVWSCFSGMEESLKNCLREFQYFIKDTSASITKSFKVISETRQEKRQFSLRLNNSLKNECHYGLKDSLKTVLQFISYCKAQVIFIGTRQCYKVCHLCGFINPRPLLRTVVAYIRQGNKYFTLHKQIITLPPFTYKPEINSYYSLLYILLYWAECDYQAEAEKSPSKA